MVKPPGPKGHLLVGVLPEFRNDPAGFLEKMARQYGDVVYIPLGRQHIYCISHPDAIRGVLVTDQNKFKKSRMLERARVLLGDGLLTSEGDHHRRQRRLVQPAFHRDRLAGYGAVMVGRAALVRDQWKPGQSFDVLQEMMRLTLAIVAKTLFSTEVDSEADEIGVALTEVFSLFEIILLPFSEILEKLPLPAVRRFKRARQRLDETIYRLIAERRANPRDTGDLLSMLLLASDEEGSGGMSDEQVRDEALTLFLAGHETTADALTWAWYLLSQNPQAEAVFHAELDQVLGGRLPSFEDLPQLRYTESVFAEALRMFPPAWGIGRRALEDYPVGDFLIPARSVVLMSPYVVHRDPRWFPDPLAFRPERWLAEDSSRPKFAYFPFGGGARVCIGERFAWMEGTLLLAAIGQRWRLRLEPGHRVEKHARITLRPKHGMRMIAESRL
ncbi:MAG TPA: cytochrome P450 [Bryobacteraceae bacterium]|jgi:cytochrome P450|nr:cytochrome P450 [Bryobacteraceae bacterium]